MEAANAGQWAGSLPLSLVLSSRNDSYQGNSRWRLQTALNFLGVQLEESRLESQVEVIVTDWGSESPLRTVLLLSPAAARVTRFLEVPPDLAVGLQNDSPFPEVLANNAAIRRARGQYIGRIDQDTLVSREFLEHFIAATASPPAGCPYNAAVLFASRRSIPIELAQRCGPLEEVVRCTRRFGRYLPTEGKGRVPWFDAPVGILLMQRRLWWEARGYDEQMLYWGYMDTALALRLRRKHPVVDLGRMAKCRFYHLSHSAMRFSITNRRKNPRQVRDSGEPREEWGLASYNLELRKAEPSADYWRPAGGDEPVARGSRGEVWPVLKECLWQWGLVLPRMVYNLVRGGRQFAAKARGA